MTEKRKRGRPKLPPIDATQYKSMTIRRMPLTLHEQLQHRLVTINRNYWAQGRKLLSQEDFVLRLVASALEQYYQEDFQNPPTEGVKGAKQ